MPREEIASVAARHPFDSAQGRGFGSLAMTLSSKCDIVQVVTCAGYGDNLLFLGPGIEIPG